MSGDQDLETLSKQFLDEAYKSRNDPDITKYIVGQQLGLPPDQTEKIASLLIAKGFITEPNIARQTPERSDFEITKKGIKYIGKDF